MERTMSRHAQAAKELRAQLKSAFPGTKFSVRSDYNSIHISWSNWPHKSAVQSISAQYEAISYDHASGEILSGGNFFVFEDNEWTDDVRAQIEANMTMKLDRRDTSYYYWFNKTAEEMWNAMQSAPAQVVEESAPVETVSDVSGQAVTVALNDEKHGVEIRFSSKPDQSILDQLRAAGFRWSGRGFWWAKQSPERITLANAIAEQLNTPSVDNNPVSDVEEEVCDSTPTVHDTPAHDEVEAVAQSNPYATPAYAANCHMKSWNDDADQLADVFNALDIPFDIAGDKFIFRGLTPEQYAHVVRINETNQAIIFDDGEEIAPKRVYIQVKRDNLVDSCLVLESTVTKRDEHGYSQWDHEAAQSEIVAHWPSLATGDYVYKLAQCDWDYIPMSNPPTYAEGEKVHMHRIIFTWSESNEIHGGEVFTTWSDAQELVRRAERAHADEHGIGAGYDKTGFILVFADGYVYQGRIDINENDNDIVSHIRDFNEFHAGTRKPAHMTQEQYDSLINGIYAEYVEQAQQFLARYILGDVDETPSDSTDTPQLAEVVSLTKYRAQSWIDNLDNEAHLKLHLISQIIPMDEISLAIANGASVDQLFKIAADVFAQQKKQM